MIDVVVGLQRGDEGKGRFVDDLAREHDIVARYNGGNNAGHTVVTPDGIELALHLIPSGIAHEGKMNVIGNGTAVNPEKLDEEMADVRSKGIQLSTDNLLISSSAHLILPDHVYGDEIREMGKEEQGTTKRGIAQCYASKAMREGARMETIQRDPEGLRQLVVARLIAQRALRDEFGIELLNENGQLVNEEQRAADFIRQSKKLAEFVTDTSLYLNKQLCSKPIPASVLAEGAQAFLLDNNHGMYPFTTSSSTTSGGVADGLGVPCHYVDRVYGVAKAVQSHVGGGPFVTEIKDQAILDVLRGDITTIDAEIGTTSGRERRLGYFDIPGIKRALMVNGDERHEEIALTKLDWLPRFGKKILVCVAYEMNGKTLDIAPSSAPELAECKPIYEELDGWDDNISGVRTFTGLPENAKRYIEFIDDKTKVPITMIGVGPQRDQVINRLPLL